jgi:hypothetical protein
MTFSDHELTLIRIEALGAHISSGDETPSVEPEELGLPWSTRAVEIIAVTCSGDLEEIARETRSTGELVVEYDFSLCVDIEATMAANDASTNGWGHEELGSELVDVEASVEMTARAGVVYEGDEETGFIEFIGVRRADGTPASPIGMLNDDAHALRFPTAASNFEHPAG